MVRGKTAAVAETDKVSKEEAVSGEGPRRSSRKRAVNVTPKVEDADNVEDEPIIKIAKTATKKKTTAKPNGVAKKEVKVEVKDDGGADTAKTSKSTRKPKGKAGVIHDAVPSTSESASSGKGKQKGKKIKVKEEETPQPAKTTPGGKGKSKKTKGSGKENIDSSNIPKEKQVKSGVERTVVFKGRAPVDGLCQISETSHVLEEGDDIWDCMLNQTNIQFNNNKYYLIQLLKDDAINAYSVWMRWGRVGANGQNNLQPCGSNLDKAKKIFMKKFSDKTKNEWEDRELFEKVPGKYDLLAMDYSREDAVDSASAETKNKIIEERKKIESKLEVRVRALIEMLCNVRIMEETVVEMKYDAKKAPLGKLTPEQIKAGYLALRNIDNILRKAKYSNMELVHACNDFYTRIPHYFGMKVPPLIRSKTEIQEKVALLDALGDIQAALSIMERPIDVNVHPVDQHYKGLETNIAPLERDCDDYKVLEKYLQSTHAKTHTNYKMELLEVFTCRKDLEYGRYKNVGNQVLLYHGSRLSNWAGILSQGLRIAPPEAPPTGYMFGKGIYFADMSSKSANYCWATQRNNVGFLALSEVSLGKTNDLLDADYNADKLPKGCNSAKGCGRVAPLHENYTKLSDGTVVPMGPGVQTDANNPEGYTLLYNEYIVYNPAQVRTRFLLKIKFHFR